MKQSLLRFTTLAMFAVLPLAAFAAEWDAFFPDNPDLFMGDYSGRWSTGETVDPEVHAQVIPLGGKLYRIILVAKLDLRAPPKLVVEAESSGDVLSFNEGRYRGEIRSESFTGERDNGKAKFEMKKVTRMSPTMGKQPPDGAVVLFDGSNMNAWREPSGWEITDDGALMVTPKGKALNSIQTFGDLEMHIEFRTPFMPRARGQQRGNSGVFINDVYEVQVLDSYGLEGYYDECGALYKLAAPNVNACAPPTQWQTYDITYRAPRFADDGTLAENGRMTVLHNGALIHNEVDLKWITAWTERERLGPPPREPGRIVLQGHNDYVQFRNIWVKALE